jgi:hypothetical protein
MPLWHGYEQDKNVHPTRPWWTRAQGGAYIRTDGVFIKARKRLITGKDGRKPACWEHWFEMESAMGIRQFDTAEAAMERIDREYPLPMPDPRVGQVWAIRYGDGWDFMSIIGVRIYDNGSHLIRLVGINRDEQVSQVPEWALLVSGSGSPWEWTGSREVTP